MTGFAALLLIAAAAMLPAASGTVTIYREGSIIGAALGCPIRYKGNEIVELGRGKFANWPVSPGRYILTNKTSSIELSVEPGETRYIRCTIKAGMLSGRADLQISDRESFEAAAGKLEEKPIEAGQ